MFFPLGEVGSVFAPDNVSSAAMAGYAARAYAVLLLLAVVTHFTAGRPAQAQLLAATPVESGRVTFASEGSWRSWLGSDEVLRYEQVHSPGGGHSWLDFKMPRLAFRDHWNAAPAVSADLAYSQEPVTNPSDDLPILPPPMYTPSGDNAILPPPPMNTAPAENGELPPPTETPPAENGELPLPATQPTEEPAIAVEEPAAAETPAKEEAKKEEKPVIPDLAKGILIATNDGDLTFKPGLRIQPRYMYETGNGNNDFFIRRFRLKGSGSAYGVAKYGVELKLDNDGRFAVTPSARVENAWLDFPVVEDHAYLRAGLYDIPFSRDSLTSDSKLLFMDRTLIKEELTGVGMADNGIGLMLHGRPDGGYFEYAFGVFDNVSFERFGVAGTRESDELMPVGRVVWSLLDPMTPLDGYADYQESYIGKGERLELGLNAAHLGDAIDALATFDLSAWGVDLFYNTGPYTFQTEYDEIVENIAGAADIVADGWYIQGGYLFNTCDPCVEFALRYQELNPIVGEQLRWTSIGFNFYIREHNLKVQTDYTFRSGTVGTPLPGGLGLFDEDVFEVQLQLDF